MSFVDALDFGAEHWELLVVAVPVILAMIACLIFTQTKITEPNRIGAFEGQPSMKGYLKTIVLVATLILISFLVLYVIFVIGVFVENFHEQGIQQGFDKWGQAGDFFGGMLNPILAFASFISLLYTIRLQSEELKLTREELAKSSEAQRDMASNSEDQLILLIYQQSTDMFNNYRSTINGIYKKTEAVTQPSETPANLNYYIGEFIWPELGSFARSGVPLIDMNDIRQISERFGFACSLAKEVCITLPGMVSELYSQNQLLDRSKNVKSLMEGRFHSVYTGVVHEYARMLLFFRLTPQTIGRQAGETAFERKIIDDAISHLSKTYFNGKNIVN